MNNIIQKKKAAYQGHNQGRQLEDHSERALPVFAPVNVMVVKQQEMQTYKNSSNSSSSEGNPKPVGGEFGLKKIEVKPKMVGKPKQNAADVIFENQNEVVIKCLSKIGDGHQSKIYTADLDKTDIAIEQCIKVFEPYNDLESEKSAEQEFRVAQCLKGHPNIVQINRFEKNKPISIDGKIVCKDFMVMEFCKNGDMYDFMTAYTASQPASQKGLYLQDRELL